MEKAPLLRAALERKIPLGDRLELVAADLEGDAGWSDAVEGVDGVFHVASPVPRTRTPRHEQLVKPALDGTLRVLNAADRAQVKRVVITSSVAAIAGGHPRRQQPFTEQDWCIVEAASAYDKSKALAERAAWDWARARVDAPEVVALNPSFVMGPLLWSEFSPSLMLIEMLLNRKLPLVPDLYFGLVDVRDLAEAHLLAMTIPEAAGQRFICDNGVMSYQQIAQTLHDYLTPRGIAVPTRRLPSWVLKIGGLVSPTLREEVVPRLGRKREFDSSRTRSVLGWQPRSIEETLRETAESLLANKRRT